MPRLFPAPACARRLPKPQAGSHKPRPRASGTGGCAPRARRANARCNARRTRCVGDGRSQGPALAQNQQRPVCQKRQPMDGEDSSRAAAIRPDMRTNVLLISGSFFCYSRKTGISAARKLLGAIRRNNSDAARFVTIPAAHFHRATVRASFCVRGASVAQSLSCPLAAARGAREHLKDGRAPPPGPLPHALFFL